MMKTLKDLFAIDETPEQARARYWGELWVNGGFAEGEIEEFGGKLGLKRDDGELDRSWHLRVGNALIERSVFSEYVKAREVDSLRNIKAYCERPEQLRLNREQVRALCPVACWANAFSDNMTPAFEAVRNWHDGGCKKHLVLRGGVGSGKSSAACYAARLVVAPQPMLMACGLWRASAGVTCLSWLRPDQVVSAVMHSYDSASPRLYEYVVIDDVGRETKADFTESLCELLDSGKHTLLITTNLTKAQMRERYDLRLLDRLNDTCIAVDLPGKSMRKQDGGF